MHATASGRLEVAVSYQPAREVMVNRIGFTILHPVAGLAGARLEVAHADGSSEVTDFPTLIAPAQPAKDFSGLAYALQGAAVRIAMEGETFEMEDQRNWSDASFKTYCRPLSQPYPFRVEAGTAVAQRLVLEFSGVGSGGTTAAAPKTLDWRGDDGPLPEFALAVQPGWAAPLLTGLRRIVRLDLRAGEGAAELADCVGTGPYDLELITDDDAAIAAVQLGQLASTVGGPDHVLALPGAYLKSHQPAAQWPTGATPAQIITAARAAFPAARIGGGMLTNFTEVNRHRPDPAAIDYLSHGTTAIVHAADDLSVIETLEALPQIFHSARAMAPGKAYRLGLVGIGMRSNPYGAGVAPNPDLRRKAMAMDDPRHRALFGAAWMVGAVAATAGAGVQVMALAAPAGPFGLGDAAGLYPCFHVIRALQAMRAGTRLKLACPDPALHIVAARDAAGIQLIVANLSDADRRLTLPAAARTLYLDADTLAEAAQDQDWTLRNPAPPSDSLTLAPFAIAFARMEP